MTEELAALSEARQRRRKARARLSFPEKIAVLLELQRRVKEAALPGRKYTLIPWKINGVKWKKKQGRARVH